MERIFKSSKGITFKESFLKGKNAGKIASKLGFGSGHEECNLTKISSREYRIYCIPYYGHPGQSETLKLTISKKYIK